MSVLPTVATEFCPKPPRKMSPMPQIAKLMTRTPMTDAMMALPSQVEEALWMFRSIASSLNLLPFPNVRGERCPFKFPLPAPQRGRLAGAEHAALLTAGDGSTGDGSIANPSAGRGQLEDERAFRLEWRV